MDDDDFIADVLICLFGVLCLIAAFSPALV